jgi:hypothetical protein
VNLFSFAAGFVIGILLSITASIGMTASEQAHASRIRAMNNVNRRRS